MSASRPVAGAGGSGTLSISSHSTVPDIAIRSADHGYVMENGRVVMDKPARELLEDDDVREFYLGLHPQGHSKSFRDVKHYRRRKRWLS